MEQTVTIKVKLKLEDPKINDSFKRTMEQYRQACNYISQYIFDHDFVLGQNKLSKALYQDIRQRFGLKSQMTQSAIRNVVARYRTVKTQLSQKPYRYDSGEKDNRGHAIWKSAKRDLTWLWRPVYFKRPQVDLQRNRDWSILKDGHMSLNTINKRVKVTPVCYGFDQYMDHTWKFGIAKLLHEGNKWMLHISATKELPDVDLSEINNVVGLDRGLRFITNSYDSHGKSLFFNGKQLIVKRTHYKKLRAQLQSKGTKSAKRRLKKIGQRENRWMTDINHQITKALVEHYGPKTLFVLEDLANVRKVTEKVRKNRRYEQVSWAFYQFEQDLIYKSNLNQCLVLKVDAHYTSQRCPKCGQIRKANRDHDNHVYVCQHCGYSSNDDRIGAMNIQQLGIQYISGVQEPHYIKLNGN